MKNLLNSSLTFFAILIFSNVVPSQSDAASCTNATDGATITYSGGYAECSDATPDELKIDFYKLALCSAKPTYTDESSCTFIINSDTPQSLEIGIGKEIDLVSNDISIAEGKYPYAMLLVGSKIGLKTTLKFATAQNGGLSGNGTSCWTNGSPLANSYASKAVMPITCGADTSANPQFSDETFVAFGDPSVALTPSMLNQRSVSTIFDIHLLKNSNVLADMPGAGGPNARFIWGVQKFDITPEITANTKSIDLGFKLTKGMIVTFNNAGLPECNNKCVEGVNLMSFAFTVDVN